MSELVADLAVSHAGKTEVTQETAIGGAFCFFLSFIFPNLHANQDRTVTQELHSSGVNFRLIGQAGTHTTAQAPTHRSLGS